MMTRDPNRELADLDVGAGRPPISSRFSTLSVSVGCSDPDHFPAREAEQDKDGIEMRPPELTG